VAQQFGGGLVGDTEPGAQRVAGDRLRVLVLVLGGGLAREGEQGLVLLVLDRGRPSRRGQVTGSAVLAGDAGGEPGRRAARRSIMETATRNAAEGDGGHDLAPGVRLGLGEVGGQAKGRRRPRARRWARTAAGW
jgi:hypothetical protein